MSRWTCLVVVVLVGWCGGAIVNPPITTVPVSPPRRVMGAANLDTLNRLVKTALLSMVTTELESSKMHMSGLQPQLTNCQAKVNTSLGPCLQCVDNACQDQFKQCQSLTFHMHSPGGMSVSSSNVNGRSKVTVCSLTSGQSSRTCSTIMNPDGFIVNSINQINDDLRINLRKVSSNLGSSVVQNFVGGMNTVVNGVSRNLTDAEKAQLQQTMNNLGQTLSNLGQHIGQGVQQSMNQMNGNLHNSLQNVNNNMHDFGNSMSQWGHNFAHQLSQSLSHMFDGTLLGRRRKRAIQTCSFLFSELPRTCATLTSQCASCPRDRQDTMAKVCGLDLVNKVKAIEKSMDELNQIYSEVINAQIIVIKVEFDDNVHDPTMTSFVNVAVTANVRGTPALFPLNVPIQLHDLATSAVPIARQIWKEWAVHMAQP